ncbi:hypothetical protein COP1_027990 [Malus domestica]
MAVVDVDKDTINGVGFSGLQSYELSGSVAWWFSTRHSSTGWMSGTRSPIQRTLLFFDCFPPFFSINSI